MDDDDHPNHDEDHGHFPDHCDLWIAIVCDHETWTRHVYLYLCVYLFFLWNEIFHGDHEIWILILISHHILLLTIFFDLLSDLQIVQLVVCYFPFDQRAFDVGFVHQVLVRADQMILIFFDLLISIVF